MPVAALSSAVVSAWPTGPGVRLRSATALRIQDSSEGAVVVPALWSGIAPDDLRAKASGNPRSWVGVPVRFGPPTAHESMVALRVGPSTPKPSGLGIRR